MNHYGRLWVLTSTAYMRNGVIVCIYKSYKVVYGSLMMDFGIPDSTVVLASRGFGTNIICLYRAMVYKFSIFGPDL